MFQIIVIAAFAALAGCSIASSSDGVPAPLSPPARTAARRAARPPPPPCFRHTTAPGRLSGCYPTPGAACDASGCPPVHICTVASRLDPARIPEPLRWRIKIVPPVRTAVPADGVVSSCYGW